MVIRARKTKRTKAKKTAQKKKSPVKRKGVAKRKSTVKRKSSLKRKSTVKRKSPGKRVSPIPVTESNEKQREELLQKFRREITETYNSLCRDLKKHDKKSLVKNATRLKLLLGECKYMENEYRKCLSAESRKRD